MKLYLNSNVYIETNEPIDISIPIINSDQNLTAWYVDSPKFEPVIADNFIGLVEKGSSTNFRNIFFNPHGHGTHTECLGHITPTIYSVNEVLKTYFFNAILISVEPEEIDNNGVIDKVITKNTLELLLDNKNSEALIIRTLPNNESKKHLNYSNSNPPYIDIECLELINKCGIKHFLIDTPSVDRENDEGKLIFHHAFWNVPANPNFEKTITELVYIPNEVVDGDYILNIQTVPFENDASPSRPVLYKKKVI